MVQVRGYHPTREDWQQPQQQLPQDGRYPLAIRPAQAHDRPLTVAQSLKEHAGLPVRAFALIAILENGQERLYASNKAARIDPQPILKELRRETARGEDGQTPLIADGMWTVNALDSDGSFESRNSAGDRRRRHHRQSKSEDSDDESLTGSRRKRSRPSACGRRGSDDAPAPSITSTRTQRLRIGDDAELGRYYTKRFKDLQQTACKIIGKVFVKAVEPKKQTHHPYTRGNDQSPPWWPPTSGPEPVRHKEPDHLLKDERVKLCVWILRLVVQPNREQHESIRHLGLNVQKLEELTTEKLNEFFNDPAHRANSAKKKFLKELFKVAKYEERYLDGGADADSCVNVMFGADTRDEYESSEDEGDPTTPNDDVETGRPAHLITRTMSSNLPSPHVLQPQADLKTPEMFQNPDHRALPMGFTAAPQPDEQQYNDPSVFGRGISMGLQSPISGDQDRRSYGSPVYQQAPNPYGWTSSNANMVSTPSMVSPFYTTSPQIPGPSNPGYHLGQMPPMLPPLHSHASYDSHPRYDATPAMGQQSRPNNLGHSQMSHHVPNFGDYHEMNGFGQPENDFKNPHLQHPQN